jgi:carbon storage regulator CsrA
MLVLSRKKDEHIQLKHKVTGEIIEVLVVDLRGDKVKLGFRASDDWKILRDELLETNPENPTKKHTRENPNGEELPRAENSSAPNFNKGIREYLQQRKQSGETPSGS